MIVITAYDVGDGCGDGAFGSQCQLASECKEATEAALMERDRAVAAEAYLQKELAKLRQARHLREPQSLKQPGINFSMCKQRARLRCV